MFDWSLVRLLVVAIIMMLHNFCSGHASIPHHCVNHPNSLFLGFVDCCKFESMTKDSLLNMTLWIMELLICERVL